MSNNEKLLKFLSRIIESGVLTSQDLKKEIFNNIKFQKENVVNKLDLVSRKEFDVLKKRCDASGKNWNGVTTWQI